MADNYDYYVDENGKITKRKKKENSNADYVVSEDGRITVVPSETNQEMYEDVSKTSMHIAQSLNSTLLGQSQMQTGSTPYAPILQQTSGKDRLSGNAYVHRTPNELAEMEKQANGENSANTSTIRPMTEYDKAAIAEQKKLDMLAKTIGIRHSKLEYYEYESERTQEKVNEVIESYKNGVPDERNPRLRTTPKNVFGYRSGDERSKERAQEYAKENPGEVAYFVGSGNQVRAYYSEKGEEPISILLQGRQDLEEEQTWLQKGSFEDGYQFGDVLKGGWATLADVVSGFEEGFASSVEGISDLFGYGVAWGADKLGYDEYADDVRFRAQENTVADWFDEQNANAGITENSFLGEKARGVPQALGQLGFLWATAGLGKTAKVSSAISTGSMFASSMGGGMSEAYQDGATDEEAFKYGVAKAAVDTISERMFAGAGKAFGNVTGKAISTLDDAAAKKIGNSITRVLGNGKGAHATKITAELLTKAGFEGAEEVGAGIGDAIAKKLTYMSDEEIAQLLADENLLDQFIVGAITSGIAQGGDVNTAIKDGTDLITERTEIEDAVVNKEYEKRIAEAEKDGKLTAKEKRKILEDVERDFAEGGISIDTIEEALGGDTYTEYQNAVNEQEAMQKEYDELYNRKNGEKSDADADRQAELKQQLDELKNKSKADEIHKRLSDEVFTRAKDSRLVESYAERERRKQKYEADLSQYDEKQRETVQRAIDSGILNNTRKTHKFVDMIAKISADKGVSFDFTDNKKLKESGFAVDGRKVNGYVTANGVTVNINSNKALNTVVGHEITHILEGTNLYTELQSAVKQYAESKGDYQSRVDAITKLYEGLDADIDAEVTADLVGDYLFTDPDFIQRLSVEHRNVFQKVYAEIKYLARVATAGSKQARQLEKAKKMFEDAYRADSNGIIGTKYSLENDKYTLENGKKRKYNKRSKYSETESLFLQWENGSAPVGEAKRFVRYGKIRYFEKTENGSVELSKSQYNERNGANAENTYRRAEREIGKANDHDGSAQRGMLGDSDGHRNAGGNAAVFGQTVSEELRHDTARGTSSSLGNDNRNDINQSVLLEEAPDNSGASSFIPNKKSLSDEGDIAPPVGSYNVYGKDIALEDIAPIREDVTPVQDTVQPAVQESVQESVFPDDFTPTTEAEANALSDEALPTFTDEDAPPMPETEYDDFTDTTALDPKALKDISKALKDVLYLNNKEVKAIADVVQKYSTTEFPDRLDLFYELQAKFGTKETVARNEETAAIKKTLREYPINVSQAIKKDITDYGAFMRRNFGKVRFSKEGVPVDTAYQDLSSMFPGYFPADITNASDQLIRIAEVAGMEINETETFELSDEDIMEAVDVIEAEVGKYKEAQVQASAEADRQAAFAHIDDIAPVDDDIAPIRDDIAPAKESVAHVAKAPTEVKTIKPVQERIAAKLENAQAELEQNLTLRAQSNEDFDNNIARMYAEYNSKKNKNTKVANDILRRIKRAERLKADVDAGYEKRISDISEKINKMNSPTYKRAEQRRSKQDEYTAQVEAIVGDTSTWVDKKLGLSYKTNTERRNLRDVVRDANGNRDIEKADRIDDYLLGNYNRNEAKLNRELSDIQKAFSELKLNSKEDVYMQMLGELRHNPDTTLTEDVVKQFYEKNKNKIDTEKVDNAIGMARQLYDSLLERTNAVLREQGMKEIPYRKGYFPHFTAEKQGLLAKIFNWKSRDDEIPTSVAGMTEEFNPNRSWQSFNKERKTDVTDYSFKQGFDHAVPGFLDWIYHMPDIQRRRAVENYIRYTHSEEGVKERIKKIRANEEYDAEEMQAQIDLVYQEARNPLNNFVTDFRARTNTLAGKKSSLDRGMEEMANRKAYSVMTNISSRVTANMVVGSVSASLTNFIPITQSWGQVSPISSLRAMGDTIRSTFRDDGVTNKSDFLTNRLRKAEKLHKTGWDKVIEKVAIPMEAIDSFTSQTVWRSKYLENISNGMSENEAIKNADQFAENVIAGRSRGNMPTIFESKNPVTKAFTAFQLEVANQYAYMFKDLPQDVKEHRIGKLTKGYAAIFIGAYAYNALYSSLVGRDVAFDPIGIIEELLRDLFGDDDDEDEENKIVGALEGLADNLLENTPFVGGIFGGGRVPISSALPYEGIPEMIEGIPKDIEEGNLKGLFKEMLNPLVYLGLPVGGGQIKKTVQGLGMFDDDLPVSGSYTDSGNLRYPVEETFGNKLQAALFGQYANKNARDYFDNERAPLKKKQIEEYIDLDLPIADYWKYREGLAEQDTVEEKLDYIDSLDLPISKKNIMANNVTDRKDPIDMTNYDDFDSLAEFDFATKNPEKYEFFEKSGITYAAYANGDEDAKRAYNWAYENPEKYIVSQAVASDVVEYRKWASELNDLTGDKDEDGKTINGSRKEKVIDYINHMDADYGAKIILFRTQYTSDDTYNSEIVEYLNNRDDISYDEMVTILQELDFTVYPDGTVVW